MKKILLLIAGVILSAPFFVSAQTAQLTDQFAGDQTTCVELQYNMSYRARDAKTNGEVSDLQDFLISQGYLSGDPTGYFGTATLAAVKKFQSTVGLGSTGTPGYGGVGPKTRAKIKAMTCGGANTTATPATSSLPVIPQATTQTTIVTPTATQALAPTISITSPQPGASFSIGDTIPIRWVFANVPQRTQTVVDIRLVAQASNASGSVAGGTWQSSEYTTRTSGNDSYDKTTGAGYLDVSGTYEIVVKIVSCDPRGCAYANSSSNTVWATSNPLRVYIGIPASQSVTPYAATFSATNITATSATLPGYTEPNGISRRFEWGNSSTGMYNTTPFRNNGTTSDFSETISGLTPSTTYYFRTVAHTAQGADVIGNTLSFTTGVIAPTLSITSSGATVNSTTMAVQYYNMQASTGVQIIDSAGGLVWSQELTTAGGSGSTVVSVPRIIPTGNYRAESYGSNGVVSATSQPYYFAAPACVAPHITSPSPLPGYSIALTAGQVGGGQLFTADQPVTYSIPPNVPMWVSLSGNKVDFATMGTPGTYNFTIVATNSCGAKDTQTIPVIVSAAPVAPTVALAANPTAAVVGSTVSLAWNSTDATSCLLSTWKGTEMTNPQGSMSGVILPSTPQTITYTMVCTGNGVNSSPASATVVVSAAPVAPTPHVTTFPATNNYGGSATLNGYTEPNNLSRRFEWGTSISGMTNVTPFRNNGTTSDFSETIAGLTPGTIYIFRAVAVTPQGSDVIGGTFSLTAR